MNYLNATEIRGLALGDRVCFPNGASAYPDFHFTNSLPGTVTEIDGDSVWVRIDEHKAELDEWQNQIQIWLWEPSDPDVNNAEEVGFDVERLLSSATLDRVAELDRFVADYCTANGIEIDGDVFGMIFSGDREWTTTEAAAKIDEAARIYGLRK